VKILISCDMEGISGVIDWKQVEKGESEYVRFTKIMTAEVNAAIEGAFAGGANEVAVIDSHDSGRNLLIEELDPRATLHYGSNFPLSMVQGVQQGTDAVIYIGYHARSGTPSAVLAHTWMSTAVTDVWLNERIIGEIGINAAVCGYFNAPIIFISGDQAACNEASDWVPGIETVVVKKAAGRYAAECYTPAVTHPLITQGVKRAVEKFASGHGPSPLKVQLPLTMTLRFATTIMAEQALILPQLSNLPDGRMVRFEAPDILTAQQLFRAATSLLHP
jgi:D-amino peptidase